MKFLVLGRWIMPGEISGSRSMDSTWRNVWFSVDGKYLAKCLVLGRWIIPDEMSGSRARSVSLMRRSSLMGASARHTLSSPVDVCGRPSRCLSSSSRNWVNMVLVDIAYSVNEHYSCVCTTFCILYIDISVGNGCS